MACRRTFAGPILIALIALALSAPAHGDLLVVFHNGRTLRVESIRSEGDWSYLTLGKKSEMGVPAGLILSVAEIEAAGEARLPNVQAAAGGASGSSAQAARPRLNAAPAGGNLSAQGVDPRDLAEQEALAAQARSDALARAAARARRGSVNRTTGQPGGQPADGEDAPAGIDLSGGPGSWPSLLDRNGRRGRARDEAPVNEPLDETQEDADDPER